MLEFPYFFFFSSRRRHTRLQGDWSSDVCSSDLRAPPRAPDARPCAARAFDPRIGSRRRAIPGSQAQMLRRQEPNSDLVSRNFVGQQLANFSLEAGRIARLKALLTLGALCLDLLGYRSRATGIEFFFANRSR